MTFEPRHYRRHVEASGLTAFEVAVAETDLQILAQSDLTEPALQCVLRLRYELESYIAAHPRFAESFSPFPVEASAPAILRAMAAAALATGVGPMAAVAGAVAEAVARELGALSSEVIVENGGDVFLIGSKDRTVELWTGRAEKIGLVIRGESLPKAIATSSATVGPSVSLGRSDATTVIASSGALADAAASAIGNRLQSVRDIGRVLEYASSLPGVAGCVVSIGGDMGAWGEIELAGLDE